jgi:glycosyltransferase involved in cell wall biosynthesis
MVPWINKENEQQFQTFIKSCPASIICGHFELNGYEVIQGINFEGGMEDKIFACYEMVLSGHFHGKASKKNVHYLGTQYQITFSDARLDKGFHVLDTQTRELEFIQNHELERIVEFIGPLYDDDKWKAYAGADIFCFPTHYSAESFGLVAVEAMMFGLPIVATNWRGLPDIVVEGETGFLVLPKDAKSIAERLENLILDPDLRAAMGATGRRRYEENFTVEKFRNSMESALVSVGS